MPINYRLKLAEPVRLAGLSVVVGFTLLTVYFAGVAPGFSNPNELSRFEMVVAAAEFGTFQIDDVIPVFGDHDDKAAAGGHLYSNKAPGLALAAIPIYRLLRVFVDFPASAADPIFALLRLLTVSLVCILAAARLLRRLGASRMTPWIAAAVVFGTPFLYYARTFFSHAWTGALLFLSWDLLRASERPMRRGSAALFIAAAGLLAGWAAISEYTVAPIAFFLALRAAAGRSWKALLPFAAGAAVPMTLLLIYQAICFGSPFLPSYAREAYPAYAELARQKLFGLGVPRPHVAWSYLFHPARGVLLFSPFLLWSLIGLVRWWRSGHERRDCLFVIASTLSFFLLLAGYPNWHGGWSLGSRYLLAAVFFVALPIGWALLSPLSRGLFCAAVVFSMATHLLLSLSFPHFPLTPPWPAANGSLWFLRRGWIAPNVASSLGGVALVLPLAAVLCVMLFCLAAKERMTPRGPLAVTLGLVAFIALLARPPQPGYGGRLWRAAMYGRYSGLDPDRRELKKVVLSARTPGERGRALATWKSYGPGT